MCFVLNLSSFDSIDLSPEEGSGTLELMPGGKDIEVTSTNVYDYVRKYAKYRMVKAQEKAIEVCCSDKLVFMTVFVSKSSMWDNPKVNLCFVNNVTDWHMHLFSHIYKFL